MVGDESALPAIAASLEQVRRGVPVLVVVVRTIVLLADLFA